MQKIKHIQGNYIDIATLLGVECYAKPTHDYESAIDKDITRMRIFTPSQAILQKLIDHWLSQSQGSYTQGDMDARNFDPPIFRKVYYPKYGPSLQAIKKIYRFVDDKNPELHKTDTKGFGYLDSDDAACGFSFTIANNLKPTPWLITIIRGANRTPHERQVSLLTNIHDTIFTFPAQSTQTCQPENVQKLLSSLINSPDIVQLVGGLIAKDGTFNTDWWTQKVSTRANNGTDYIENGLHIVPQAARDQLTHKRCHDLIKHRMTFTRTLHRTQNMSSLRLLVEWLDTYIARCEHHGDNQRLLQSPQHLAAAKALKRYITRADKNDTDLAELRKRYDWQQILSEDMIRICEQTKLLAPLGELAPNKQHQIQP